jgi:pilus assembly protein CpaE
MQNGRVITVASASGGCGKTFLATNLAWFLSHHGHRSVCVLDLDLRFGEVGTALRLRPDRTIADLVRGAEQPSSDDIAARLEACCERHASGIHVLAAPDDPGDAGSIRPADIGALIDAARRHFDDVIIDTPPVLTDVVTQAIDASDEILILATPDVPSLRNLRVYLGTLDRLQVPDARIHLILNKADHDAGVEVHELLASIPHDFDATLPVAREVERSIAAGRPVMLTDPGADIAHRLGEALRRLLPAEHRVEFDLIDLRDSVTKPRRWWRGSIDTI